MKSEKFWSGWPAAPTEMGGNPSGVRISRRNSHKIEI